MPTNNNLEIFVMSKEEKLKVCYNIYKTSDNYLEAVRLTGIGSKTYYRYRVLFRSWGLQGTLKRMGKWGYEKKAHNRTPDNIRKKIELMRREDNYGSFKISEILLRDFNYKISDKTVGLILREKKLNKTTVKYPTKSKGNWDRVIPYYPGDVIQADPVQFGDLWIVNLQDILVKWRAAVVVDSLTVESIKDHIGLALSSFPFGIKNLQWDNGSESEKDFAEYLLNEFKIQLRHTAPASPWQNGVVERLNRVTRDEEFGESKFRKEDKLRLQAMLDLKVKKYNEYRPHWSLGLQTPLQVWKKCMDNDLNNNFVKFA